MHNLSIFHILSGQKRKQTFAFSNSLFLDESELANEKVHIDKKLLNFDFFSYSRAAREHFVFWYNS